MNAKLDENLYEEELALFANADGNTKILLMRLAKNRHYAMRYLGNLPKSGTPTPAEMERINAHLEAHPELLASAGLNCECQWSDVLDEDGRWPFVRCLKCRCTKSADQLPLEVP